MPRGRKKKLKLNLSPKPGLLKSIAAVVLILFAGLCLVSFLAPSYSLNERVQEALWGIFGYGSLFIPFVILLIALFLIDSVNFRYKKYTVLIGLILFVLIFSTFSHLFIPTSVAFEKAEDGLGGGMVGYNLSQLLISTISIYGAVLIVFGLAVLAFILVFDITLDQIVGIFSGFFGKVFAFKPKEDSKSKREETGEELEISPSVGVDMDDYSNTSPDPYQDPSIVQSKVVSSADSVFEIIPAPSEPQHEVNADVLLGKGGSVSNMSNVVPTLPYSDKVWENPPLDILYDAPDSPPDVGDISARKKVIKDTLRSFGINVEVVDVKVGPAVTQYSLDAEGGTRIAKITNLQSDIALALASPTGSVRIEAPIPGKSLIGIEVPNNSRSVVNYKDLLTSDQMKNVKSKLGIVLGKDVGGLARVYDIGRMPHLLVAGATGSGKSVFLHSILFSILFKSSPTEVKFILIDPKRVELVHYQDIPHLLTPVVTDTEKAPSVFKWAVAEMERRYKLFESARVRNIDGYNEKSGFQALPYIVIVCDELAEIMVADPAAVEKSIIRLGQLARATGIHLVLAVQRPSTDILTGLIKANIPSRVAFNVASQVDSRVIIDQPGAEKLLGKGDMLFVPPDVQKPIRLQGAFIRDKEITSLVSYLKSFGMSPEYNNDVFSQAVGGDKSSRSVSSGGDSTDSLYQEAYDAVISSGKASTSFLQRRLSIGYSRAARILDELEANGIISAQNGSKPREVLARNEAPDMSTSYGNDQAPDVTFEE